MDIERYEPTEQAAIRDIILRADELLSPLVFQESLREIGQQFVRLYLQDIEDTLRREQGNTFLHAIPANLSPGSLYEIWLPQEARGLKYVLSTAISSSPDDPKEVESIFELQGITYHDNFQMLAETGLLVPRLGTETSRMSRSHLN